MATATVFWHRASGYPAWPYLQVPLGELPEALKKKAEKIDGAVALRCLPLEPVFYDVASPLKLEAYPADKDEKVAACRKDKRKAISGKIDDAVNAADAALSAPPVPEPAAAAAAEEKPGKAKLKLKVKAKAAAADAGSKGAEAPAAEAVSAPAAAPPAASPAAPTSVAADAEPAGADAAAEAPPAAADAIDEGPRPERRMTKVRMKLLGIKVSDDTGVAGAGAGAGAPAPAPAAGLLTEQAVAADDDDFVITKARKPGHKEKKDKKKEKEKEKEREKEKGKGKGKSAAPVAGAGAGKRKTVVDSDDEMEDGAGAGAAADSDSSSSGEQSPAPAPKKRKREEEEERQPQRKKAKAATDGATANAPSAGAGAGAEEEDAPVIMKKKKAKSGGSSLAAMLGYGGGEEEEEEDMDEGEDAEEEDSGKLRLPAGVPQPPVPFPTEADSAKARELRAALQASASVGDVPGLLKSLFAARILPVSLEVLTESKITDALKPLRTYGQAGGEGSSGTASAPAPAPPALAPGITEDDLESVRDLSRALLSKFKADCAALAEWRTQHKDALASWEAVQARHKAQAARTAKMMDAKRRKAEERRKALEEMEGGEERAATGAGAGAGAGADSAMIGSIMDLETSLEPEEPSRAAEDEVMRRESARVKPSVTSAPAPAPAPKPAPAPAPAPVVTGADLLGMVKAKPAGAGVSSKPAGDAGKSTSQAGVAAAASVDKEMALVTPSDPLRAAAVTLLSVFLQQAATNTRDSDKESSVAPVLLPSAAEASLDRVCTRVAVSLENKLHTALGSASAASVGLPQEPLAAMRAVLLYCERMADAHPRPDGRALTLPVGPVGTPGTVPAARKLLALLADGVPRLRTAAGKSATGVQETPDGSLPPLTAVEKEVFGPLVPLLPGVLRAAFTQSGGTAAAATGSGTQGSGSAQGQQAGAGAGAVDVKMTA